MNEKVCGSLVITADTVGGPDFDPDTLVYATNYSEGYQVAGDITQEEGFDDVRMASIIQMAEAGEHQNLANEFCLLEWETNALAEQSGNTAYCCTGIADTSGGGGGLVF